MEPSYNFGDYYWNIPAREDELLHEEIGSISGLGDVIGEVYQVRITFENGNTYVGGYLYTGGYLNGLFEGKGRLIKANGEIIYQGDFSKGKFEKGIYREEGQTFNGFFVNGLPVSGLLEFKDKSTYEGRFKDSRFNGKGTFTTPDGRQFKGIFSDGELLGRVNLAAAAAMGAPEVSPPNIDSPHNFSDYYWNISPQEEDEYSLQDIGSSVPNVILDTKLDTTHYVTIKFNNGNVYSGTYLNGLFEGPGTLKKANGELVYDGTFSKGKFQGQGVYREEGRTYKGSFVDGLPVGLGLYEFEDQSKYFGRIVEGRFNGYGIFITPEGKKIEGYYSEGKLMKSELDMSSELVLKAKKLPLMSITDQEHLNLIRSSAPGELFRIDNKMNTLTKVELGICQISDQNIYMKVPPVFASLTHQEGLGIYQILYGEGTGTRAFTRLENDFLYFGLKIGTINGREITLLEPEQLDLARDSNEPPDYETLRRDVQASGLLRANHFMTTVCPPKYFCETKDKPVLVSEIFEEESTRYCCSLYVDRLHGLTFQLAYFSKSQGDWRAPPAVRNGHLAKVGLKQGDYTQSTLIKNPLQAKLTNILKECQRKKSIKPINFRIFDQAYSIHGVRNLQDFDVKTQFLSLTTLNPLLTDLANCLALCRPGHGWKMNNQALIQRFTDPSISLSEQEIWKEKIWENYVNHLNDILRRSNIIPDFSKRPISKYTNDHHLLGEIKYENYASQIGYAQFHWHMGTVMEEGVTRHFISSISLENDYRSVNLPAHVYDFGMLPCKPIEYKSQTGLLPKKLIGPSYEKDCYVSVLKALADLEPIRRYREAKSLIDNERA